MIRIFDILFSFLGLLFLTPLLVIITILTALETGSPFFFQERVGKDLKKFMLLKFRTMKILTPSVATHLVNKESVTKIGKILRLFKFDELLQLWNVLKGDMSIVGPRPCLSNQIKLINERKKRGVFNVKPGITGLAQIQGINMSSPKFLSETDLKMIKHMNYWRYFYYIFKTFLMIIRLDKND